MGKFTKIAKTAFDSMQFEAGLILNTFNPKEPTVSDEHIVCATTGGVSATCVPEYQDLGSDVDNCPKNVKQLKKLMSWECGMGFTALNITPESLKMALGAATVAVEKVTPDRDVALGDFSDIWWVGDRTDGGMVAICLKNALSTGGLSIQTTKNGKGQMQVSLTGHADASDLDTMPMEFYSEGPAA